jgi:hypothetical protein
MKEMKNLQTGREKRADSGDRQPPLQTKVKAKAEMEQSTKRQKSDFN